MKAKILFFLFIFANILFCSKDEKGPVGIVNQINTCYMNGALQCLYNVEPLTKFLLDPKNTKDFEEYNILKSGKEISVSKEYILLTEKLSERKSPVAPITFCKRMWIEMGPGSERKQDDSHQFLLSLISHLSDKDINKEIIKERYGFPFNNTSKNFVGDLFNTILKTTIICPNPKCNLMTTEGAIESILSIPIIEQKDKSDLKKMLEVFFSKEKLAETEKLKHSKWKGKEIFDQFKQYTILDAPPFLILHLKIFDNAGNKITIPITIPINNLDLSPYFEKTNAIKKMSTIQIKYDLIGIVQHAGSTINSGHYTAYVKYQNQWYYCDDDSTEPIDFIEDFQTKGFTNKKTWGGSIFNPYILFYKTQTAGITKAFIKQISEKELLQEIQKLNITQKNVDDFVNSKRTPTTINDLVNGINQGFVTIEKLVDLIEDFKIEVKKQGEKKENQDMINQFYSLNISLRTLS